MSAQSYIVEAPISPVCFVLILISIQRQGSVYIQQMALTLLSSSHSGSRPGFSAYDGTQTELKSYSLGGKGKTSDSKISFSI